MISCRSSTAARAHALGQLAFLAIFVGLALFQPANIIERRSDERSNALVSQRAPERHRLSEGEFHARLSGEQHPSRCEVRTGSEARYSARDRTGGGRRERVEPSTRSSGARTRRDGLAVQVE